MTHELPDLPYAKNALEPSISAETLEFHHDKHHATYVANLNNLIPGTEFEHASLEDIVMKAEAGIFNNGAQVCYHSFYFNCMAPDVGGEPTGDLAEAIIATFGSFAEFKEKFSTAGATNFGSGWTWLVKNSDGELEIVNTTGAGNPMRDGKTPILTMDVWEHAYYIDKRNARPAYIADFWNLVNWDFVSSNFSG